MTQRNPIGPGQVLGLFGGGQLGRMFAQAAARLGYRVHLFAPEPDAPAGDVSWRHTRAEYEDADAVAAFARQVAAVTCEFENVPACALHEAARHVPVSPQPHVFEIAQNRIRERAFLTAAGLPASPHAVVRSEADLAEAVKRLGTPVVVKSASGGYDGKGQRRIDSPAEVGPAWNELRLVEGIVEQWVTFDAELSVIVARDSAGRVATYGPMRNVHRHHILDHSVFPAGVSPAVEAQARELAGAVAEALSFEGVCCVEMFLATSGKLLINELAPRPHNSGHLTIEGHHSSQFEQQVRTMCAMPLGGSAPIAPAAAMANLLGDLWPADGSPPWEKVLADPEMTLHLYGKAQARRGRKMGHLTARAATADQARDHVLAARAVLATGG